MGCEVRTSLTYSSGGAKRTQDRFQPAQASTTQPRCGMSSTIKPHQRSSPITSHIAPAAGSASRGRDGGLKTGHAKTRAHTHQMSRRDYGTPSDEGGYSDQESKSPG